ncbi:hypothetical protein EH31_10755 [Erythrobacter longus]|uniref:CARDB domain-containing protein n=1 Tax=Erythrobacter longus TaxID=1044 RepID=A0A074MFC2_ERYLO|nr:CARDB domain-containing protein [Erythrobacter longus]KEO90558.1 hypothetical protein EH31_10755 [Erythrobacter longus]
MVRQSFRGGDVVDLEIDIRNAGQGDARRSEAAVFLVIDGVPREMRSNSTNALDAGRSDTGESLSFALPSDLQAGRYTVLVVIDARSQVAESNEDNNSTLFFIDVDGPAGDPDLEITDLDVGSQDINPQEFVNQPYAPGDTLSLEIDVQNTGVGNAASSTAAVHLSFDNALQQMDTNRTTSLDAGERDTNESLSFEIPTHLSPGVYGLAVRVDDGEVIDEADENNNSIIFFITVEDDFADQPGDNDTINAIGSLQPGGNVSGVISGPDTNDDSFGDRDVFQITLEEGQRYTFTLEGDSDLQNGLFTIRDGDDFNIRLGQSAEGRTTDLEFVAPSSGVFYIRVGTGQEGQTGAYTLRASQGEIPPPPPGADLRVINARLDETTVEQGESLIVRWEIENIGNLAIGATSVAIRLRDTSDGSYLINPENGTQVFASGNTSALNPGEIDTNESASIVVPSSIAVGSYEVEILALPGDELDTDVSNNIEALSLVVTATETPPTNPQSNDDYADQPGDFDSVNGVGMLAMGSSISGEIGPRDSDDGTYGDKDVFLVSLEAGQTYLIELTAQGLPLGIFTVRDPSNFSNVLQVSRIGQTTATEFTPGETGNYWIRVGTGGEPNDQGGYTLSIDNITSGQSDEPGAPPAPADDFPDFPGDSGATSGIPTLSLGSSIRGSIEVAGDKDVVAVDLVAGQRYQFSLEQAGRGAEALQSVFMTIRDPDNFNDVDARGGGGSQATITFDATESGTFFVRVGSGEVGGSGDYLLNVENIGMTPAPPSTGGPPPEDIVDQAFDEFVEILRLSVLNFSDPSTWEGLLALTILMDDVEFERFARKIVDLKIAKTFPLLETADIGIEVLFAVQTADPGQGAREGVGQLFESLAGAAAGFVGAQIGRAVGGLIGGLGGGVTGFVVGSWAGAAIGGVVFSELVYTQDTQDDARQLGYDFYDFFAARSIFAESEFGEISVGTTALSIDEAELVQFDEQWYVETYPDALSALQSGAAGSAYAHFLTTGIDLGYQPNQAQTLTRADLATQLTDNNPLALGNTAVLTLALGEFAGDGLSDVERTVGSLINGERGTGALLDFDAGLSSIASRKATDLIANFTDDAIAAALAEADSGWAQGWSNGNQLTQQFRGVIEELIGESADASRLALFAVASETGDPADILSELQNQAEFAAAMSNAAFDTIGIAEFGGLWVVVLADREADYTIIEPGADTLTQTSVFGGTQNDQLIAGGRSARLYGLDGDDSLIGGNRVDFLSGGLGDDRIDGGSNVDTAVVAGLRSQYTVTQTSTGQFTVVGPEGTDTLSAVEFLRFDDELLRLLPGAGVSVAFDGVAPASYQSAMENIRDFDGNTLGGDGSWLWIGASDINGDGDQDQILVNREIGRFATVGTGPDGLVYFDDFSWAGETRVAGIYIDPLVADGTVEAGGDFDSQRRFQNDLQIENINRVLGADDYDGDGIQEVYFALTDGTAYLRALMHADGNIRYANYQSEEEVREYLTSNGFDAGTFGTWFTQQTDGAALALDQSVAAILPPESAVGLLPATGPWGNSNSEAGFAPGAPGLFPPELQLVGEVYG